MVLNRIIIVVSIIFVFFTAHITTADVLYNAGRYVSGSLNSYTSSSSIRTLNATSLIYNMLSAIEDPNKDKVITHLKGKDKEMFIKGKAIYEKEGYCATCHQPDGKGLSASGFPPLAGTKWVLEDEERLIKLTLKGLLGPIEINGKKYPGQVTMTQFQGLLNDEEMAAVLTYVRNDFGNKASVISPEKVKEIRAKVADKKDFYSPEELLKEHPIK